MDLFAFICHSDPTKVRIGERELAKHEVKLLKMTEGHTMPLSPPVTTASEDSGESVDKFFDDVDQEHSVERGDDVLEETIAKDASEVIAEKTKKKRNRKVVRDASGSIYPPKKLRDDYQSLLPNTSRKSLATLRGVVSEGSAIPSGVTEPLIATSVAPVSNLGPWISSPTVDAPVVIVAVTTTVITDIATLPGLKSRDTSKDLENIRDFAFAGGANADATSISKLNKPSTLADSFYASQSLDTETMHRIYVHRWKGTNDSILEDRDVRHVCLGAEVRMRAKHTLERKGELEDKFAEQTVLLSERDAEIANVKSLLSLKESEAAEAIRPRGQLTTVEAADVAKDSKLKDLKVKNFFLEGERDVMSEKIATLESANAAKEAELASLSSQVIELTSDLSGFQHSHDEVVSKVASLESKRVCLVTQGCGVGCSAVGNGYSLDEEFYPRFLTTLSGRRWFLTYGLKLVLLKCLQSSEYLQALGQAIGCAVNKCIQDGLKAWINHGQVGRVANLRVQRFREEVKEKRSLLTDVKTPLVEPLSFKSLTGEASTSAAPITTLSTTFASFNVVVPTSVVNDQVLDVKLHKEDPPVVDFEKEELGTSPE
nr:hypothetical protein [Tanacetum cinerariifolium]